MGYSCILVCWRKCFLTSEIKAILPEHELVVKKSSEAFMKFKRSQIAASTLPFLLLSMHDTLFAFFFEKSLELCRFPAIVLDDAMPRPFYLDFMTVASQQQRYRSAEGARCLTPQFKMRQILKWPPFAKGAKSKVPHTEPLWNSTYLRPILWIELAKFCWNIVSNGCYYYLILFCSE